MTHYCVVWRDGDDDWQFMGAGSLEELLREPQSTKRAKEVDSFDASDAIAFGQTPIVNNCWTMTIREIGLNCVASFLLKGCRPLSSIPGRAPCTLSPALAVIEHDFEINAQTTEQFLLMKRSLAHNPYDPRLLIAMNSLETPCEMGLMGKTPTAGFSQRRIGRTPTR